MTILFEVSRPFRLKPKIERIGSMTRGIWLVFSFACIRAGFNDLLCAFEQEGWDRCVNGEPRPVYPYNVAPTERRDQATFGAAYGCKEKDTK